VGVPNTATNSNYATACTQAALTLPGKSPTLPPHEKQPFHHYRHYHPALIRWVGLQFIGSQKPARKAGFFVKALQTGERF
jgi:hypothetical protein